MSQKNHNSLDSILNDMAQTVSSVQLPNKITIINNAQAGGSDNVQNNKSNYNVNKLLSMLATESATSSLNNTQHLENELRNMLELKGGKPPNGADEEFKAFIRKYNIKTLNGIDSKQFLKKYNKSYGTGPDVSESSPVEPVKPVQSDKTTEFDSNKSPISDTSDNANTPESMTGGARGMNPGFKAFIDLKKKIAEMLGIPNGPKAAKIAGSIQKEMKEKYADLTSVQLAAKGLEHFKKDPSKYKKMV
jgi:hypothetical protein